MYCTTSSTFRGPRDLLYILRITRIQTTVASLPREVITGDSRGVEGLWKNNIVSFVNQVNDQFIQEGIVRPPNSDLNQYVSSDVTDA